MDQKELSNLIQELIAIPTTRWKNEKETYGNHTIQNPEYIESYKIEHRTYHVSLEGYYGGMNSGIVKLNIFPPKNGHVLPLQSYETMRKEISTRVGKIPTALAELYAKIQQERGQE